MSANSDERSESDLMAELARGDLAALGVLYERYARMVSCVAASYLTHVERSDVSDLCHEVFLTLAELARRYRDRGKLASLLRGITIRKARSLRRRRWVRQGLLTAFGGTSVGAAAPREGLADAALAAKDEIERGLAVLSVGQREVVLLRFVSQLKEDEIAAVLKISPETVRTRLHRAREVMRALRAQSNRGGGSQ